MKTFREVAVEDPNYILWFVRNNTTHCLDETSFKELINIATKNLLQDDSKD